MMKSSLSLASAVAASLCLSVSLHAADPVPPTPPGGATAAPVAPVAPATPSATEPAKKGEGRPGGLRAGGNPGERLKELTEKLNLTPDQQEKIKAIYEKNGPQLRELMAKGRDNLTDADKEKLRELMKNQREEMGAILTAEQKEKAKELREAGGAGRRKPQ